MDIFAYIDLMDFYIERKAWDELEAANKSLCQEMAGEEQAARIASIDLSAYSAALLDGLLNSVARARRLSGKAVYFEYHLYDNWRSHFFVCRDYLPKYVTGRKSSRDADWISDWLVEIEGPDLPAFGSIFIENGFASTDIAAGTTLYLIARTVAAFGHAAEGLHVRNLAVCMGFHSQQEVMRIIES